MKAEKLTSDLNFTVRYADGAATKYVEEGVLFEFDREKITLHLGTERKEALFSIAEALTEAIIEMGLGAEFKQYVGQEDPPEKALEYICDELCRHPRTITNQAELDEICAACPVN